MKAGKTLCNLVSLLMSFCALFFFGSSSVQGNKYSTLGAGIVLAFFLVGELRPFSPLRKVNILSPISLCLRLISFGNFSGKPFSEKS